MALTPKQQRFVEEYVVDFNGAEAARRAGYSKRSAKEIASQLLARPEIAAAVKAAAQKVSHATQLTAEEWWRELGGIVRLDAGDVFDFSGDTITLKPANQIPAHARRAISSIRIRRKTRVEDEQEVLDEDIDVQFHSKLGGTGQAGKALGILTEKVEHSGKVETAAVMTDEQMAIAMSNLLQAVDSKKAAQDDNGAGAGGEAEVGAAGVSGGGETNPGEAAAAD